MKKIQVTTRLLLLAALSCSQLSAFAPVNFFETRDSLTRLPFIKGRSMQVGAYAEVGASANGYSFDSQRRNILALHDDMQGAAHMLLNPVYLGNAATVAARAPGQFELITTALPGADANAGLHMGAGVRTLLDPKNSKTGASTFEGDFSGFGLTLHATKGLPWIKMLGDWNLAVYLPVASRRVRNIRVTDKTENILAGGTPAQQSNNAAHLFNQNLASNMQNYFGQDLSATDVNGVGDLGIFLNWHHGKEIGDKYFKHFCGFARVGVSVPTGSKSHTAKPFRMPLGNDGAWGLSFSTGAKAELVENARLGIYFDGMVLFDTVQQRRVKTHTGQSEFMLINTAKVRKQHGFTFNTTPYLELNHFAGGVSAKLAYQYTQHNKDKLRLRDPKFEADLITHLNAARDGTVLPSFGDGPRAGTDYTPHQVINTANSLKRWDAHNIILQLTWDIARDVKSAPGAPQLGIFYKRPLSGRNMIDTNVFGGHLAMNF